MDISYNRLSGQSVERLAALSDGIFGVAMTLLLLDLQIPDRLKDSITSEHALLHALAPLLPRLAIYLMSFLTLGIFWVGQQAQLSNLRLSERHFTWITLFFLFAVTLVPFSTRLLAEFITFRTALLAYWLNILVLGVLLYASWGRATRAGLVKEEMIRQAQAAICRRIIIAQCLYAAGAALCFISTTISLVVIVLVQLNYVFAPAQWFVKDRVLPLQNG